MEILTQIEIKSSKEKIWNLLMDFDHYPDWNPFIIKMKGQAEVGHKIEVLLSTGKGKTMLFKPTILKKDLNREFRWIGKLGIKGIFDGEHFFQIQDSHEGTCTFFHGEKFSGILVPLVPGIISNTKLNFEKMNLAIKNKLEN